MRTVNNLLQSALSIDLEDIMAQSMSNGKDIYIEQQKLQMFDGINVEGLKIEPEYHPFTVIMKEAKGQPSSRVTLKDTGSFYAGIFADVKGDKMYIDSKDSKSNALQEKYGDEVFGIGGDYRDPFIEKVQETIIATTKNKLQL